MKLSMFRTPFLAIIVLVKFIHGIDIETAIRNIDSAFAHPYIDFPQITSFKEEYDFIIVGCGTSGSLLANRLTEVPSFQVLCVEAGHKENAFTEAPSSFIELLNSKYAWKYKTEYQSGQCEGFNNNVCSWPRGKAIGGSSVINAMMYTRAHPKEYDHWAQKGNYGWGFKDVLPYITKFENFSKIKFDDKGNRGLNGELDIEYVPYESDLLPYILKAAEEQGIPNRAMNGRKQIRVSRVESMMRDGRRLSAANAFLFPIFNRPNLHVAKNTFVTKIQIDPRTKIARGVEISFSNVIQTIKARKEVILSAGTINSPQLLMLSGVGPSVQLKKYNINVIKDLPVGKFLKDHVGFFSVFFLLDKPPPPIYPFPFLNYLIFGRGILTQSGGGEALAFFNVGNKSYYTPGLSNEVPDIEIGFNGISGVALEYIVGSILGVKEEFYKEIFDSIRGKFGLNMQPVLLRPKSIGHLELRSTDPFAHPKIYPNYFGDESDLETLVQGIRMVIKIGSGKTLQKFSPKLHKFKLKPCDKFPFNSDNFWKCTLKLFPCTLYHPIGTCKMGPDNDRGAVVDPELRVKGIKRLRVVDASIMPEIPSAHLTSTCYMIAEKAAAMIKEDYGVSDV